MIIDTGTPEANEISIKAYISNYVLDDLPEGVSDEKAAEAFAHHIIWKMAQPKTMATVRKHYLANWAFLARLAQIDPEMFDECQRAYGDRAYAFDHPELVA